MAGLQCSTCRGDRVRVLQTNDLDAFDSYYDEAPSTRALLMANLSSYDSDVLSEVPISDTYQDNYVLDHCVQEMYYSKEPPFVPISYIKITSDSNIISYDQYMKENESKVVQSTPFTEEQNAMIMFIINEISNQVAKWKDTTVSNLKKHIANLKEKDVADCNESVNCSRVVSPRMYKLDLQPLAYTLRKHKEVHEDYLKVTKEHGDTLYGIVEQARALEPSDNALDYTCKYAQ
nr:hypothetical protein [Tanacetum cinerariifolium]